MYIVHNCNLHYKGTSLHVYCSTSQLFRPLILHSPQCLSRSVPDLNNVLIPSLANKACLGTNNDRNKYLQSPAPCVLFDVSSEMPHTWQPTFCGLLLAVKWRLPNVLGENKQRHSFLLLQKPNKSRWSQPWQSLLSIITIMTGFYFVLQDT